MVRGDISSFFPAEDREQMPLMFEFGEKLDFVTPENATRYSGEETVCRTADGGFDTD